MLVGRERELAAIGSLIDQARSGHSGVLGIVGDAGIGKSELLRGAERLATGMTVLHARGVQSEAQVPFAGLLELFRPVLQHLAAIPEPQRIALEAALALRPPRSDERFAIGAATLSLLAAVSEDGPLVVVVDDAQWIDGSTADALLFAFRRLLADPVAVLVAVRGGEPSLVDTGDLPLLRLQGLDRPAAGELLELRGVELGEELVDRLYEQTGGNPLALVELAADKARLEDPSPLDVPIAVSTSVARLYAERCNALPPNTVRALLFAAANDTADVAVLARAAQDVGADLADLAPAEEAGLVRLIDGRVEFCHPLARAAIYADAPPADRRKAHRAIADALPDADFDRRAWHLALAALGPDDSACSALEQAGKHARDRSAYEVAARTFQRASKLASQEQDTVRLLYAAAEAAWLAGQSGRAVDLLERLQAHETTDEVRVAADELRGHIATRLGPVHRGHEILLSGADLATKTDPDRAVLMLAEAVNAAFYAADPKAMTAAASGLASIAPQATSRRSRFFSDMAQGMTLIFCGEGERGAATVRRAVELVEGTDDLDDDPRLLAWVTMGPIWLREGQIGAGLMARALEAARRRGAAGVLPFLLNHLAISQAASYHWAEAEAGFQEAIGLARETGQRTELSTNLARLAWLEARQGREAECRAHAAEVFQLSSETGAMLCEIWALTVLGELELSLGDARAALARFGELERLLRERGIGDVDVSPAPELVEVHLRLGHTDEAAAYAQAATRLAAGKGQPWALARAARCAGLVAGDGEFDHRFREALDEHAQTPDVFETARTRLAYGARLRRARRRLDAREQLNQAIEAFDDLGAVLWSDLARKELGATGQTARRRDPSTFTQLSPQELRIALLLAEGRTTRETAAALFLSPKTVEFHLRNVYRKLGVNTRSELAARLPRTTTTGDTASS